MSDSEFSREKDNLSTPDENVDVLSSPVINASGHVQELDRNFSLLSICSVGICTGNTWASLGGMLVDVQMPTFLFGSLHLVDIYSQISARTDE
jgi:hypothetical protein